MVGRAALIGIAVIGIVVVPASAAANAGGARLFAARTVRSQPAHRSACDRRAHRRRDRCRRARHRDQVGSVEAASVAPPSSNSKPPPSPGPRDTTPPKFGGLESAFTCTPGPQRPGQTTPFNLSWEAAVDDVTPPALIVYEIYLAAEPGGEDFAHPTWTTDPGATSFRTPGLPSHGDFYFVVRARDAAGNEDANTVERHGVDPCL
jgi:hypothetical protein